MAQRKYCKYFENVIKHFDHSFAGNYIGYCDKTFMFMVFFPKNFFKKITSSYFTVKIYFLKEKANIKKKKKYNKLKINCKLSSLFRVL